MSKDGRECLLRVLMCVIKCNLPEMYLCLICLLNLTYCHKNARAVVYHVPKMTMMKRFLQRHCTNGKAMGPLRVVVIVTDPHTIVIVLKKARRLRSELVVSSVILVRGKDNTNVNTSRIPSTSLWLRAAYTSAAANHIHSNLLSLIQSIKHVRT